jgi:hypothetical protein
VTALLLLSQRVRAQDRDNRGLANPPEPDIPAITQPEGRVVLTVPEPPPAQTEEERAARDAAARPRYRAVNRDAREALQRRQRDEASRVPPDAYLRAHEFIDAMEAADEGDDAGDDSDADLAPDSAGDAE